MTEMLSSTPSIAHRSPHPRRVFVLGATGTIGRATVHALLQRGHEVVCLVRPRVGVGGCAGRQCQAPRRSHAPLRRCHRPRIAGARRLSWRALRCAGVLHGVTNRSAEGCLGHRSPGAPPRADRSARRRRVACGAAVGDLRAETSAGLSARQARVRERAYRIRRHVLDRQAYGVTSSRCRARSRV